MTTEQQQQFEAKLRQVGLPFEKMHVFGTIRLNIHVVTIGEDTARKWVSVLATILPDGRVAMVRTSWDAKENKGTCLLPTKRRGWLVAVTA